MDSLAFIANIIGKTGRVGGSVALAALAVYVLRTKQILLTDLNQGVVDLVYLAGIIGVSLAVVDVAMWVRPKVGGAFKRWRKYRIRRRTALKNLKLITVGQFAALHYLKAKGTQRFRARVDNGLLYEMRQAHFIEIDDPNWSVGVSVTYYKVPSYVWSAFTPPPDWSPPQVAPWERPPGQRR